MIAQEVRDKIDNEFRKEGAKEFNVNNGKQNKNTQRVKITYEGIKFLNPKAFSIKYRITNLPNEENLWETRENWKKDLEKYLNNQLPLALRMVFKIKDIEVERGSLIISATVVALFAFLAAILSIIVSSVKIIGWISKYFQQQAI